MRTRMMLSLALALGVSAAAQDVDPDATLPPPFTAAQIRQATKAGRRYVHRIEAVGEPVQFQVMEFLSVSERGAQLRNSMLDADRKPIGEASEDPVTWEDLERHAHFPRSATRVTEAELVTPAGTFACMVYRVREVDMDTTYWFAKELPGAPVKVEVKEEGTKVVYTMTLVEHANP
jgi:hypothetical protein